MTQAWRLAEGGRIDRSRTLGFTFNGRAYAGHPGDTLASALVANGVRLVARSFKYHRPRGIVTAGGEEPNAQVEVGTGALRQPNLKATQVLLHEGLTAGSQNCWPSVGWDLGALFGLAAPLLPAGFYYKTFMWPSTWWESYERAIRRVAGLGRAPTLPDPDRYEHLHASTDVLVIGAGVAGLAATFAAAASGLRVLIADDDTEPGGQGWMEPGSIDGMPPAGWIRDLRVRLEAMPRVSILPRTTVYARYEDREFCAVEEMEPGVGRTAQRRWFIHAGATVLATGASERPICFADNDLPGVMLASAARTYVMRYAARPGSSAVVFASNDSAYAAAAELERAGVEIRCIVDVRQQGGESWASRLRCREILRDHAVVRTLGRGQVRGCEVAALKSGDSETRRFDCDLILTGGGWNPRVHLSSHLGSLPVYDERISAFLPSPQSGLHAAGSCAGVFDLEACLESGRAAGIAAASALGATPPAMSPMRVEQLSEQPGATHFAFALPRGGRGMRFVDLQNDVTLADLELAWREGYRSMEHIKRYTTVGMGTDQGKLGNVNSIAYVAALAGRSVQATGTTTFRPPYAPVTLGAIAGRYVGRAAAPVRVTPLHAWHKRAGAVFMNAGHWKRAQLYPRPGEGEQDAVNREARNVREAVGIVDISTLGKFDLQGRDVAALLERVYANGWRNLAVGRSRYGAMLRPDGMVFDDGTASRLGENHWFMTTTTGNAERVYHNLTRCLQVEWPGLDVRITPVTEQWGAMAIAGPRARALLARLEPDFAISNEAYGHLSVVESTLGKRPVRVFRISFTGELGYEIYAPAALLPGLWEDALVRGADLGIMPYGTEAMMTLRIEKGFIVPGFEADGRTTLDDLGMGRMLSAGKDCIGKAALQREGLSAADRLQLVGVVCKDPSRTLPRGAQLVAPPSGAAATSSQGHLTSVAFSPLLGRWIGLALLSGGRARLGEVMIAASPVAGEQAEVEIVAPVFVDPQGERTRG